MILVHVVVIRTMMDDVPIRAFESRKEAWRFAKALWDDDNELTPKGKQALHKAEVAFGIDASWFSCVDVFSVPLKESKP